MEVYMEIDAAAASAQRGSEETQIDRDFHTSDRATADVPSFDAATTNSVEDSEDPIPCLKNNFAEEKNQENDMSWNHSSPKEASQNYTFDLEFNDDCFIPSPVLRSTSKLSFFGPDLGASLQKIGIKYNSLLKKHHAKDSEAAILRRNFEILLNKCLLECQPKYEALEKEHSKCQDLISDTELLRAKFEALSNKCIQEYEPKYENLKGILAEETAERKRLYNELIELRGNIRVFCRCRPLSTEEISKGYNAVIEFDPSKETELQITCADSSKKLFKFDHVFSPTDEQEAVFSGTLPLVKSVMDGFNVCIFAYGQTGTGKTFTMEGTPECRGVNYRALEELFQITNQRLSLMRYEFSFSMLEVYNEKIRDLLADGSDIYGKKLDIKQSAEGTQEVPGLAEVRVCTIDEVWEMLTSGGRNRAVGSTNANELSSRSHSLVRVTVKGENLVNKDRSKSFLWLVDLAGSERVGKIEADGERLKESQFINKSLSALGDVISALASKNSHIPYRNSKLTHLLQSSLGGDCKTLMIAQISPSLVDLGETLCTLNFASRVRGVEHGPARKQSDPAENFKLKQMAEKLRMEEKEAGRLNESLQMMHIKYASRENVSRSLQEKIRESEQACKTCQQKNKDLENQIAELKSSRTKLAPNVSSRSFRPPLAPTKDRPPLARMTTNRVPHFAPPYTAAKIKFENKENAYQTMKDITGLTSKPLGRARRISLSPVVCNIAQPKRRATIATKIVTVPPLPMDHASVTSKLSQSRALRWRPMATFPALHGTPKVKGSFTNQLKYSSPSHLQATWKPSFPSLLSPRQQNRIFSSDLGSDVQSQNKLCYSIQKKVIVGSKKHLDPRFREEKAREIGTFGKAQRIPIKNRRNTLV